MGKRIYHSKQFQMYLDGERYWELLETGQPTDLIYPDHFRVEEIKEKYYEAIHNHLEVGEQYFFYDEDYIITNRFRVFNCKHKRFLSVKQINNQMISSIRLKQINLDELIKNQQLWMTGKTK